MFIENQRQNQTKLRRSVMKGSIIKSWLARRAGLCRPAGAWISFEVAHVL